MCYEVLQTYWTNDEFHKVSTLNSFNLSELHRQQERMCRSRNSWFLFSSYFHLTSTHHTFAGSLTEGEKTAERNKWIGKEAACMGGLRASTGEEHSASWLQAAVYSQWLPVLPQGSWGILETGKWEGSKMIDVCVPILLLQYLNDIFRYHQFQFFLKAIKSMTVMAELPAS